MMQGGALEKDRQQVVRHGLFCWVEYQSKENTAGYRTITVPITQLLEATADNFLTKEPNDGTPTLDFSATVGETMGEDSTPSDDPPVEALALDLSATVEETMESKITG